MRTVRTKRQLREDRATVVAGIRARRALLEQEIYEYVSGRVPELMVDSDNGRRARARATTAMIVGHCLDAIAQGSPSSSRTMPQAVLERARAAAREGASVGPLLRAVEAGYRVFTGSVIAETQRLAEPMLVREHLRKTYGGLLGDITEALDHEYERVRAGCGSSQKRNGAVYDWRISSALTRREREVLEWLLVEHSYKEIAQALCVTTNTVHTHASQIYRKLGVKGRDELRRKP